MVNEQKEFLISHLLVGIKILGRILKRSFSQNEMEEFCEKYVGYFLVFIAIVMAATKLVVSAKKPDDLKNALASFTTILVGSALYF